MMVPSDHSQFSPPLQSPQQSQAGSKDVWPAPPEDILECRRLQQRRNDDPPVISHEKSELRSPGIHLTLNDPVQRAAECATHLSYVGKPFLYNYRLEAFPPLVPPTVRAAGIAMGVYTSASQWNPIMGSWSGGSSLPLYGICFNFDVK